MSLRAAFSVRRGAFELSLELRAQLGEVVAVLGPNGAGKSTLLAALAGLVPLTRGELALGDRVLERADQLRRAPQARRVGMLFQGLALFEHMSVIDNVAYGPRAQGLDRAAAHARARDWLARLGIDAGLIEQRPSQLSGGQAQRVALARALITAPELLLLDEPLRGLDVTSLADTRRLLAEVLSEFGGVCVIVTHALEDARQLADRVIVLEGGRVIEAGAPEQLLSDPKSEHLRAMLDRRAAP